MAPHRQRDPIPDDFASVEEAGKFCTTVGVAPPWDEARANLQEAVELVLAANRAFAKEDARGFEVVRGWLRAPTKE